MKQNIKAALFDLDGVLIDTEGIYSEFWSDMAQKYDVPVPNFSDVIKGTTLAQILNTYFSPAYHEEIIADLIRFEKEMTYRVFPGVMDFLEALSEHSIKCAIVTSSGEKKLSRVWKQHPEMKGMFQAIITDAQVQRSKPDPQGYLLAAEDLKVPAEECVVFEDSFNGLKAGKAAGAMVIALATTNPPESLQGNADLVIDGFTPAFIRDFFN